jgi:hypothetical protein
VKLDDAIEAIYRGPLDAFVETRKKLAAELKAKGDKAGAAALAKRPRPTVSAWTVDQLWWHARAEMDAMFSSAKRLREGKLDATAAHRDALAALRARAAEILREAEHAPTESTLRRITTTLSALAAAGGWDPDPPGALAADRDPPGFSGVGVIAPAHSHAPGHAHAKAAPKVDELAERRKREERARAKAERDRLKFQLKAARATVAELERQLAALPDDPDDD